MTSYYSFPILSVNELVAWLTTLPDPSCRLSSQEIGTPTQATVEPVYYQFVQTLMGVSPGGGPGSSSNAAIQALNGYPQLHEVSCNQAQMIKSLSSLMSVVGVRDFTWRDLITPDKKRTVRNLSALINFAKFRQDRLESFNDYLDQTHQLASTRERLEDELAAAESQRDSLQSEADEAAPQIASCQADSDALAERLADLHKVTSSFREDIRSDKSKLALLTDSIEGQRFALAQEQSECEQMDSQIVRSPERLKRTLSSMNDNVDGVKREIESGLTRVRELESKLFQVKKADNRINERISLMVDLQELQAKSRVATKELKEIQGNIAENQETVQELSREERFVREQLAKVSEKLLQLQSQFEKKRCEADITQTEVETELAEVKATVAAQARQTEINVAKIEQRKRELERIETSHQEQCQQIRQQYQQLQEKLSEYHAKLRRAMK